MGSGGSKRKRRRALTALAVAIGAGLCVASPHGHGYDVIPVEPLSAEAAVAGVAAPTELDTIEVTGTRLRGIDTQTAQPLLVLDRAGIDRTGASSLADLLQRLTVAGSAANASVSNSEVAGAEVDLRNLGSQRVLVLVNGRRWVGGMYFRSTSSVDLNTIPLHLVERIEVFKDGASAVYGSDAVAGVVNIILRQAHAGWEARAQTGAYADGGTQQDLGLTWGQVGRVTSLLLDIGLRRQGGITNGERELTQFYRFGAAQTRGFPQTPRGTLLFVPTQENANLLGPALCPVDESSGQAFCQMILRPGQTISGEPGESTASVADRYEPYDDRSADPAVNDLYDPNPLLHLRYPDEQATVFGALSRRFGDTRLRTELLYAHRRIEQNGLLLTQFGDFAPERFDRIFLAADQAFNPFGQDLGRGDASGVGSGIVLKAISEAMPNIVDATNDSYRAVIGVDGVLPLFSSALLWSIDSLYAQSRNAPTQRALNLEHLALALGPRADCDAAPGCVPLNILGAPGAISPQMLDYVSYQSSYRKRQDLTGVHAGVSGELPGLLRYPVKLAAGLEYRRESYRDQPDELIVRCVSASCFSPTAGAVEAFESYAETETPLALDRRFMSRLDLGAALRHSRYAGGLEATTFRLGLRWQPVDDVLMRISHSTAFRAPSISDLFLSSAQFNRSDLVDPCSDYAGLRGGQPQSAEVQDSCRAAGVPPNYEQGATVPVRDGGNPELEPERSRSLSAGMVFSPARWPAMEFELDGYRIEIENAITLLDPQRILDACHVERSASRTCTLVSRDAESGAISELRFQPLNIGSRRVQGFDFAWRYGGFRAVTAADLSARVSASYLWRDQQITVAGDGDLRRTERQGTATATRAFPRWRVNAELVWRQAAWTGVWGTRYIGAMNEDCDDGLEPSYTALGLCSQGQPGNPQASRNRLPSVVYHDVQIGRELERSGTSLALGVRNLSDRGPPASYTNFYNAFDASTYELPGMQWYARVRQVF